MKHKHNDIIEFDSDYSIGDLVRYQKIPKSSYSVGRHKIEYSRIMFITANIDNDNRISLKYKMENGKMVSHSEIICVESKYKPERKNGQ